MRKMKFTVGLDNKVRVREQYRPNTGRSTQYALVSDEPIGKEKLDEIAASIHGWTKGMRINFECQSTKLGKNVLRWSEWDD